MEAPPLDLDPSSTLSLALRVLMVSGMTNPLLREPAYPEIALKLLMLLLTESL